MLLFYTTLVGLSLTLGSGALLLRYNTLGSSFMAIASSYLACTKGKIDINYLEVVELRLHAGCDN